MDLEKEEKAFDKGAMVMKLEHLIQAYNFNKIPAKIEKEIDSPEEKAGVIKFTEDIYASYLLDEEEFVSSVNLFINAIKANNLDIQLKHTTDVIIIIQKTIELITDVTQEEANNIMKSLGLFNGKLKEKAVRLIDYIYEIKPENGIIIFSMLKENKEIPPVKSQSKK